MFSGKLLMLLIKLLEPSSFFTLYCFLSLEDKPLIAATSDLKNLVTSITTAVESALKALISKA